jgi:hypothetical protein
MTRSRPFTTFAAIIFAIIALAHLYRLFTGFQIILGSHAIPIWMSYAGVLIPAILAVMLFRESRN